MTSHCKIELFEFFNLRNFDKHTRLALKHQREGVFLIDHLQIKPITLVRLECSFLYLYMSYSWVSFSIFSCLESVSFSLFSNSQRNTHSSALSNYLMFLRKMMRYLILSLKFCKFQQIRIIHVLNIFFIFTLSYIAIRYLWLMSDFEFMAADYT